MVIVFNLILIKPSRLCCVFSLPIPNWIPDVAIPLNPFSLAIVTTTNQ